MYVRFGSYLPPIYSIWKVGSFRRSQGPEPPRRGPYPGPLSLDSRTNMGPVVKCYRLHPRVFSVISPQRLLLAIMPILRAPGYQSIFLFEAVIFLAIILQDVTRRQPNRLIVL